MAEKKPDLSEDQKNKYKYSNWVLIGALLIVLAITLNNTWVKKETVNQRIVKQEDIYCISSLCLIEGTKTRCIESNPAISHMIVTEDPQIKDAYRLIVNPTNRSCGFNSTLTIDSTGLPIDDQLDELDDTVGEQ